MSPQIVAAETNQEVKKVCEEDRHPADTLILLIFRRRVQCDHKILAVKFVYVEELEGQIAIACPNERASSG
jgi:hypothetical protein